MPSTKLMAETQVENPVCHHCGADMRPGALFCYSCGKALAREIKVESNGKKEAASGVWRRGELNENGENQKKLDDAKSLPREVKLEKNAPALTETIANKQVIKPVIQGEANLKSAANLRRKSKILQKRRVEIIWEERETTPDLRFVLVAVILMILAGIIIYLALYLR